MYVGDYGAGPVSPAPVGVVVRPDFYEYDPKTDTHRIDFTFTLNGNEGATRYLVRAQAVDINGNISADSVFTAIPSESQHLYLSMLKR